MIDMDRRLFLGSGASSLAALGALPVAAAARAGTSSRGERRPLMGVCYYPEQTAEAHWPEDAAAIAKMGFTFVRAAEFSWSGLEPEEGRFDFAWLGRAIEGLLRTGVDVVLGTPSAAPPPWLTAKYPEVLIVDEKGTRLSPGGRRFTCPSNPTYRRLAGRMAERMGAYFSATPGVIGWQIDNELAVGRHARCYCGFCRAGFQAWLRNRYGNLDAVNAAWGTAFWSQTYTDFEQIPAPLASGAALNPGLQLDYFRFQSDSWIAFLEEQAAILRRRCPDHWLTTNSLSIPTIDGMDLYRSTRELDFFSLDNYPGVMANISGFLKLGGKLTAETLPSFIALTHDSARSVKAGKPHLVMEQQAGKAAQLSFYAGQPEPGQIRLWAFQAIAHGAMGLSFFRWDTARFGAEQYWFGLLDHDRTPGPSHREVGQAVREIASLGLDVLEAPYRSEIGLVYDYRSAWTTALQPAPAGFGYSSSTLDWYRAAARSRAGVDVIDCTGELSRYRVILAPAMFVVTKAQSDRIRSFVASGGAFITGFRAGVQDEHAASVGTALPGLLRDVMGVTVDDHGPLPADGAVLRLEESLGAALAKAAVWRESLTCETAQPLATYADGDWAGKTAITANRFGKGFAVYIGAGLEAEPLQSLLGVLLARAGIKETFQVPADVELTRRGSPDGGWTFLLNHAAQARQVTTTGPFDDLLTGERLGTDVPLAPYQVRILRPVKA